MGDGFTTVIGLEVHAQLATQTKIFCGCSTRSGAKPNVHTCPVCLGLPGALPVLNRVAVEYAVLAGLALNCDIRPESKFDRKNYFYPDLPKGYQITQFEQPICRNGYLDVQDELGETFRVRIRRIHLEEDAGKLVHGSGANITQSDAALVDYNRAGVPLIEIVTEPDLHSPAQARAYLTTLKSILKYTGVSDCNMEEGSLRVDANISLMPAGSTTYGTRTELKNMNSFRALERALAYEVERQAGVLSEGGKVVQETRTWEDKAGVTVAMRSKEDAEDYRYFPEPDLQPLCVDASWVQHIRTRIGELPREKQQRFMQNYGLSEYAARVLTLERDLANYFEEAAQESSDPQLVANWVMGEFLRLVKEGNLEYSEVGISGRQLAGLLRLLEQNVISSKIAKAVFEEMFKTGKDAEVIVAEQGLTQLCDESALNDVCAGILAGNPQACADYRAGKDRALKYLVGQVMKSTQGKANPQLVNAIFERLLAE